MAKRNKDEEEWRQGVKQWRKDNIVTAPSARKRLPKSINDLWATKNCPKGGQVWLYEPEDRCRGFLRFANRRYSVSANITRFGKERAIMLAWQWVWRKYCELGSDDCPFEGLLEKEL